MQQAGIGSIDAEQGMHALAQLVASSLLQLVVKMHQTRLAQEVKQHSFSSEVALTPFNTAASIAYAQAEAAHAGNLAQALPGIT